MTQSEFQSLIKSNSSIRLEQDFELEYPYDDEDKITEPIISIRNIENLTIDGNNHTITIKSQTSSKNYKGIFSLKESKNITIKNLKLKSFHDRTQVNPGTDDLTKHWIQIKQVKSSNVVGYNVQNSQNINFKNVKFDSMTTDFHIQKTTNLRVDGWISKNCMIGMGISAHAKNTLVNNFDITMDPINCGPHWHAFYIRYTTDVLTIKNGKIDFYNKDEIQRCPMFTIHDEAKGPDSGPSKDVYVENVVMNSQYNLHITKSSDLTVFKDCTFNTIYPNVSGATSNTAQIFINKDCKFEGCIFNLSSFDGGFVADASDVSLRDQNTTYLYNCKINCFQRAGYTSTSTSLFSNFGNFVINNCVINWDTFFRIIQQKFEGQANGNTIIQDSIINSTIARNKTISMFLIGTSSGGQHIVENCKINLGQIYSIYLFYNTNIENPKCVIQNCDITNNKNRPLVNNTYEPTYINSYLNEIKII